MTNTKHFRWDDAGATVLNGVAGSMYSIMKRYLVEAGWTIEFDEPANYKVVLRNSLAAGGSGCYVRILDDGSFTGGARVAGVTIYENMTDIDTGTVSAGSGYIWKALTATADPRAYTITCDERTLYITTYVTNNSPSAATSGQNMAYNVSACGFGDYSPAIDGDTGVFIAVNTAENPGTSGTSVVQSSFVTMIPNFDTPGEGFYIGRNASLSVAQVKCGIPPIGPANNYHGQGHGGGFGIIPMPTPGTSGYHMLPAIFGGGGTIRGRMRGLFAPLNNWTGGGATVGTMHSPFNTLKALNLACLAGCSSNSSSSSSVGRLFVETELSWDEV